MSTDIWDYVNPLDVTDVASRFRQAEPYPHVCIDRFLQPHLAREVGRVLADRGEATHLGSSPRWPGRAWPRRLHSPVRFPPPVRLLDTLLSSGTFRRVVTRVTGVADLVADPDCAAGGMQWMQRGDALGVHARCGRSTRLPLHPRLGLVVFLHKDWEDGWGGSLDLWEPHAKRAGKEIVPFSNRAVLLEAGDASFHGVSRLRCPKGVVRKSFATFYYSASPSACATSRGGLPPRRSGWERSLGAISGSTGCS